MINSALLKDINVDPFLHANAALAPNRNATDPKDVPQTFMQRHGRLSLGFGLSMKLSGLAIECYYNPIVLSQKNEIKSEF